MTSNNIHNNQIFFSFLGKFKESKKSSAKLNLKVLKNEVLAPAKSPNLKQKDDISAIILNQVGTKTKFVPTNFGAMKVEYKNYLFVHHFTRNQIARYRCEFFEKHKCSAQVLVKGGLTYEHSALKNHNHKPLK